MARHRRRELVSRGEFIFATSPADVERRFPVASADNPAAWDLTGLDPTVQRYDLNVGDWSIDIPRPNWAVWLGDTWRVHDRFTLNLGVRWDVDWGILDPPDMNSTATFNPVGGVVPHQQSAVCERHHRHSAPATACSRPASAT